MSKNFRDRTLDWGLADPSYFFDKKTVNGTNYAFVRKSPDKGVITPAISAMLNGYMRGSINLKWGGSLGFGISNNLRARLYAGPSLIIGRKERIVISFGPAFGAISRLANGYTETSDDDFKADNTQHALEVNASLPSDVPTVVDRYKFGWYFAIGFNLSGKDNKGFLEKIKFK